MFDFQNFDICSFVELSLNRKIHIFSYVGPYIDRTINMFSYIRIIRPIFSPMLMSRDGLGVWPDGRVFRMSPPSSDPCATPPANINIGENMDRALHIKVNLGDVC